MSVTLIGSALTNAKWSITAAETGVNVAKYTAVVKPEVREGFPAIDSQWVGFAVGDPMINLTVEGEVIGSTGLMAIAFGTAATLTNVVTFFGLASGGMYPQEGTYDMERGQFQKVTINYEARTHVT